MGSANDDGSLDETLPSGDRLELTRATSGPDSAAQELVRGTEVGRYLVLDRLGSGSMGTVMLAFDASLDRKVALKLVASGRDQQRLLREAQAMAKLAHPNVVTVFEVGTFRDDVYLAMEYVPGTTLGEWLRGKHRREIVAAFVAAGQGLAAAHRAGIVHRDFKPANVLVATDGRVRVADFGLATAPIERSPSAPPIETPPHELDATRAGAVLGTPAYMSPEQHRGERASAAADQFAFCVALYEALYGELPFEGSEYVVYAENVLAGRIRELRRGADVPARLRRVVLRGLALAPADRHPSMNALVAELARDPAAKRAIAIAVAAAVIAVGGSLAAWLHGRGVEDPCAAADQPLADLWDAGAREKLAQAFSASGVARAAAAAQRVTTRLDGRAKALREARRDACLATAVRHEQSPELLDRRMQCIDHAADETRALIAVLTDRVDAGLVDKAIEAASSLRPVELCADRAALLAPVPPAASPEVRARVAELQRQVDRADALDIAGKFEAALAITGAVAAEAERLGYAPLRARALRVDVDVQLALGNYEHAVDETRDLVAAAATARDDALLAKAAIIHYALVGSQGGHADLARELESVAVAAVERAGNTVDLRGDLDNAHGSVELAAAEYARAADHFKAAVAEYTTAVGANNPKTIAAMGNLGVALESAGQLEEARTAVAHVYQLQVELFGPDHPGLADSHYQLGTILDSMGKPEESLGEFRASTEIDRKVYPPDSKHIAISMMSEGVELSQLDRLDEAVAVQERAVAILQTHPDDNAREMATALMDLAASYARTKRLDDALHTYDQALGLAQQLFGPDHLEVAHAMTMMGNAESLAGHRDRAKNHWKRALAICEAKVGPDDLEDAQVLVEMIADAVVHHENSEALSLSARALAILESSKDTNEKMYPTVLKLRGEALYALGRHADAANALTRARDLFVTLGNKHAAADARGELAMVAWERGDRAAAVADARAALAEQTADHSADPDNVAKLRDWLARHATGPGSSR